MNLIASDGCVCPYSGTRKSGSDISTYSRGLWGDLLHRDGEMSSQLGRSHALFLSRLAKGTC